MQEFLWAFLFGTGDPDVQLAIFGLLASLIPSAIGAFGAARGARESGRAGKEARALTRESIGEARGFKDIALGEFQNTAPLRDLLRSRLMSFRGNQRSPFANQFFGGGNAPSPAGNIVRGGQGGGLAEMIARGGAKGAGGVGGGIGSVGGQGGGFLDKIKGALAGALGGVRSPNVGVIPGGPAGAASTPGFNPNQGSSGLASIIQSMGGGGGESFGTASASQPITQDNSILFNRIQRGGTPLLSDLINRFRTSGTAVRPTV
jgi:hypothetical protein